MTARQRHHRPEDAIQRAIVQHYRQRAAPGVFMFAVPNGGFRRPVEAAILKATGTVAGIPDTIWIKDGQVYALELKARGGQLSEAQQLALIALGEAGATAAQCAWARSSARLAGSARTARREVAMIAQRRGAGYRRFVLKIEGARDKHDIHGLRRLLKRLLRGHDLRCVDAYERPQQREGAAR